MIPEIRTFALGIGQSFVEVLKRRLHRNASRRSNAERLSAGREDSALLRRQTFDARRLHGRLADQNHDFVATSVVSGRTDEDVARFGRLQVDVRGTGTLIESLKSVRMGGHIAVIGVLTDSSTPSANLSASAMIATAAKVQGLSGGSWEMFEAMYPTKSWDNDALVQPEGRALFAKLLRKGWIDSLRERHPGEPMYTFWSYWRNHYERDAGLRIDHLLLSPELSPRLVAAGVDRKIRGKADSSDHAPAWITLA